jgi:hypothetical protein
MARPIQPPDYLRHLRHLRFQRPLSGSFVCIADGVAKHAFLMVFRVINTLPAQDQSAWKPRLPEFDVRWALAKLD